jgi:hypothetical protein
MLIAQCVNLELEQQTATLMQNRRVVFYGVSRAEAFQVRVSFLEVYNEEVRDLLTKQSKTALEVREHRGSGVYIKGLTAIIVKSLTELQRVFEVNIL